MATHITSKSKLKTLATKLDSKSNDIAKTIEDLSEILKSVNSYDGIDISAAANLLNDNLTNISADLKNITLNIFNYIDVIQEFDSKDFNLNV